MSEETVFTQALKFADTRERAEYLECACAGNASLLARVNELLERHEAAGSFLVHPAIDHATLTAPGRLMIGEGVGSIIGPYKLLQQIGEGGMGSVYMAEQERPVRRRVALKIIKLGMDTKQVIARFEAERQALAIMDHPGIARVLDAGSTAAGRPYFVMELVRGSPITEYCDKNRLGMRERLALFADVCRAVQHAHQKGIIHRDIKPSNVLITVSDESRPLVKVIDFGIAKATNQRLTERTLFTEHRQLIGTPQYMSPEQADNDAADVDTRTDVYSLGVLLYELFTGTTPLKAETLRALAYDRMQQAIRESESPRPSMRLSTMGDALASIAANRNIEPAKLARALRGELDWIAMKCLEKDRTRRYETASGLARDVERFLADEAVEARPATAAYRLRKFANKNRRLLITAGAFAVLLMGATVLSTILAIRANNAKKDVVTALGLMKSSKDAEQAARTDAQQKAIDAQESEADTQAFANFLSNHVLSAGRPSLTARGLGVNVTMIEALERAEPAIDEVFKGRPRAERLAREQIGMTWKSLGRNREAERQLRRALELKRGFVGETHPATLETTIALLAVMDPSDADKAMEIARRAVAAAQNDPGIGTGHYTMLLLRAHIGSLLANLRQFDKAISELEDVLAKMGNADDPANEAAWIVRNSLASAYSFSEDRSKAGRVVELTAKNVRSAAKAAGDDSIMTVMFRVNLANAHLFADQPKQAIEIMLVELPRLRKLCGPDHEHTQEGVRCLVSAYFKDGQRDNAMARLKENVELVAAKRGPDARETLEASQSLAEWSARFGSGPDNTIESQTTLLRKLENEFGENDPRTSWQRNLLALSLESAGRREEALAQFVQAMEADESRETLPEQAVLTRNNYGTFFARAKQWDDAIGAFERTLQLYEKKLSADSPTIADTHGRMGGALLEMARFDDAIAALEKSLSVLNRAAPHDLDTFIKRNNLAVAYQRSGKLEKAIEIQEANVKLAERSLPAGHEYRAVFNKSLEILREALRQRGSADPAPRK